MGGAWLVNEEHTWTLEAPAGESDQSAGGRNKKRPAALAVEAAAESERTPTSSVIAEEDETFYARYDTARLPPAIPYIAPEYRSRRPARSQ
jgi:hypothetical protein